MKKIIVPTDFSETAANAFKYAQALADVTCSQLKVTNYFHPAMYNETVVVPSIDEIREQRVQMLDQFVNQNQPVAKEVMTSVAEQEVIQGMAVDELVKISTDEDTDFIMMGTTGEGGMLAKLLGSVSSDVSQKAHCPVWLVPPKARFNGLKRILYAGNYESANAHMINEIANVSRLFNAEIHLVHVNESSNKGKDWEFEELVLSELFKKEVPEFQFHMNTVQSDSTWKGLYDYASEEAIDLIVLVTRHRSFWERLRHKSLTKTMILHADTTPLLVLHVDD